MLGAKRLSSSAGHFILSSIIAIRLSSKLRRWRPACSERHADLRARPRAARLPSLDQREGPPFSRKPLPPSSHDERVITLVVAHADSPEATKINLNHLNHLNHLYFPNMGRLRNQVRSTYLSTLPSTYDW